MQIPVPLISVILVRVVSGSAAVGLILDIFKEYGPDSLEGTMASIMMGCTETVFYTMSVYFMAAHIRKTRWTLPRRPAGDRRRDRGQYYPGGNDG